MLKINDLDMDKTQIGESINSNRLVYASTSKYVKENNLTNKNIKLRQLKLFYERDECLLAIQFVLKDWDVEGICRDVDSLIYLDPRVMGPVDTDKTTKNIDEITLNLDQDEEIYLIKGNMESSKFNGIKVHKIVKMGIYTTYGQYIEFGKPGLESNFSWEYNFNFKFFDGFIVGWDESQINYLASLVNEKPSTNTDEKNIILCDTTYESRLYIIEPIYLTPRYGRIDSYTTIEDDLHKLNIFQLAKEGKVYISAFDIYYDKHINAIEVEYTNKKSGETYKSSHCGTDTRKNKDKKSSLQLTPDDSINYVKFTYDSYLQSFYLKTFRGKNLICLANIEGDNKVEIYDNSVDRVLNLLGIIVGHQDRVSSVQFYYEKKYA